MKIIKQILSIVLTIIFLVSVMGINLFHHKCNITKEEKIVLFEKNIECNHKQAQNFEEQHNCCNEDNIIESCKFTKSECCDTEIEYVYLDVPLFVLKSENLIPEIVSLNSFVCDVFQFEFETHIQKRYHNNKILPDILHDRHLSSYSCQFLL